MNCWTETIELRRRRIEIGYELRATTKTTREKQQQKQQPKHQQRQQQKQLRNSNKVL